MSNRRSQVTPEVVELLEAARYAVNYLNPETQALMRNRLRAAIAACEQEEAK